VASTVVAPEALSYAEARARVLAAVRPMPAHEVPLAESRGRALRSALVAPHDLPPFRNSSMDGIGVRSADLAEASLTDPVTLAVTDEIPAGRAPGHPVARGECQWVMTGAMLPEGADAIVPIEDLEVVEGGARVRITTTVAAGQNVRAAGADVRAGDLVLAAGRELSAHDVALLAALGIARPAVGPAPRVVALSTGDKLLDPGAALRPGAIRDSNLPMLVGLLEEAGARAVAAERLGDDPAVVAARIERALAQADVVITLGGVSAGRHDPVKLSVGRIGGIALWRVAMKPGRPQAFGAPAGRLFFGLPGNPASVACVFEALVRPALRRLQGFSELERPRLRVRAAETIESRRGRTDFVRVTLAAREGAWWATEAGAQVSGHVRPQSRAHALLVVPESAERLVRGEEAEALLLRWPPPE
jgi:molybdopterin molybdotransferase